MYKLNTGKRLGWSTPIAVKKECIYVATRLSPKTTDLKAHAALAYIYNLKQSLKAGAEIWRKGHIPYVPGWDILMYLELDGEYGLGGKLPYDNGLEWVRRCDSILIYNGLEDSAGVQRELEEAERTGKRIYYSLDEIPSYDVSYTKENSEIPDIENLGLSEENTGSG